MNGGGPRLLLSADVGGTNVGGSLARAAADLGIEVRVVETRTAWAGPGWWRAICWRLFDHRPPSLMAYNRALRAATAEFRPDVLITIGTLGVTGQTLQAARRLGAVTANWSTDDPWSRGNGSRRFRASLREYDWAFSPRRVNLGQLRAAGVGRVEYLPFAYDPVHCMVAASGDPPDAADALFVGGGDADRARELQPLLTGGLRVVILGSGWDINPLTRAACRGQALPQAVARATVAAKVNVCLVRRANRDGHVMRSYEIPALGGCAVVEDTADHRGLFGDTAAYFANPDELAATVGELAADPPRREALAAAAQRRVTAGGNTYRDRLARMLELVGVSPAGGRT